MMKRGKVLASLTALSLTAAAATPAMALENEFHGMYRILSQVSNFNQTINTPEAVDGGYYPGGNPRRPGTSTYFEQRARLGYTAKVNPDLKLVTLFEVNADFGDNAYSANGTTVSGTMGGGAIGSRSVNLKTAEAYVDANIPSTPVKLKIGIQPLSDSYKSVIFDTRAAGISASAPIADATVTAAFFRFNDNFYKKSLPSPSPSTPGNQTEDFYLLDGKYSLSKDMTLGASYYLYYNDNNKSNPATAKHSRTNIHMFGVNAEAVFGPATINGFAVYQTGKDLDGKNLNAFALNLGSQCKAGTGTAHTEILYLSGDRGTSKDKSNAFWVTQNDAAWENAYDPHLLLLARDTYAMVTDNSIVFDNMHNQGVIMGSIGYDLPLAKKLTLTPNVGFAAVNRDNSAKPINPVTGKANKSDYLGTELNVGLEYKMYENIVVIPRFAYVILGDYYKGVAAKGLTPENPYMASVVMNLSF
jgi:hypothetical protein